LTWGLSSRYPQCLFPLAGTPYEPPFG
jgi:hypothetical protein